jgi:4-hydroxy-tetrahydrodipicolinate synthase
VDWIVRAGAHGIVYPVMASEYTVLSYPERVGSAKLVVDTVAGRVPVVIGVADTSKDGAVHLAEEASEAGADAIIAMPPWATKMGDQRLVRDYYQALTDASGLPVVIQNAGGELGSSLPARFVVDLCQEIPLVQYLKEEKPPQGESLTEVLEMAGPDVKGVFSGSQCRWLISDYRRGVCGCMPASYVVDIDVQIWNALEAGDDERAREIYDRKIVLENSLLGMPGRTGKEVMRQRGVISSSASRSGAPVELDPYDQAELDYDLELLEPYFTV